MTEDEPLVLGSTRLRFLETPGHTPESVCILVDDLEKDGGRPQAVLTGDTLFIGDVGRPDLFSAADLSAEELAGQPAAPAYFALDAQPNRQERPILEDSLARSLRPLSLVELLAAQKEGAKILDVRDPHDYCRKHLQGSMNIGLGGKYATWAGSLLDPKEPLVILAESGREREAALRLGRIGFDIVLGYLAGGPAVLTAPEAPTATLERIDGNELQQRMQAGEPPLLLDVRAAAEHAAWRMPGSLNVPLNNLEERMAELPQDRHMVVSCLGGYRSTIACSMLAARGYDHLTDLAGGIRAWPGPTESD
jgi:rhodanese-related sulfurtransferase